MKITHQLLKKALIASFAITSTLASANTHTLTAWTETGQPSDILLAATQSTLLGPVVSNATAIDIIIDTDLIIDSQSGAEALGSGLIKMQGGRLSVIGSGISISNDIELNNAGTSSQEWGGILLLEKGKMTGTISGTLNGHTNQLLGSVRASVIVNKEGGDIDSIEVDFSYNTNKSTDISSYSGVLLNIGNYVDNDEIISRIRSISGNFIGNSAIAGSSEALSGAILNDDGGHMGLLAQSRSMEITGNYTQIGSGAKEYIGIYNDGVTGNGSNIVTSIIQMNAYGEHKITVNDGISGRENYVEDQIININNNLDGFSDVIDASSAPDYSTVEFNSLIEHQTINVENGILSLGSYNDTINDRSTEASLENSILNIKVNGLVRTNASYLKTSSTVTNEGTLELTGGTLSDNISNTGTVSLVATADVTIASGGSINGGAISQQYNTDTQNASLHVETGGSLNNITAYQLNFQKSAGDNYTWNNFLSWESAGAVMDYDSLSSMLSVSFGKFKLDSSLYTLTENTGTSYSLALNAGLISSSTWRYEEVTASNPAGLMSVIKNDYNSNTQSYTSTQQNIVFEGVFGDDMLTSEDTGYEAMQSYKWDTLSDGTRILVALAEGETGADIIAYSSYNFGLTFDEDRPSSNVNSSQIGTAGTTSGVLGYDHWSSWSYYVRSRDVNQFNITGDMVGMNVYSTYNFGDQGTIGIINDVGVTIGSITGDYIGNTYFLNNQVSSFILGHATILMNVTSTVNNITGDFISNTMRLEGNGGTGSFMYTITLSFSGVMSNMGGSIGMVSSDFISNGFQFGWNVDHDDALLAGAIVQHEANNKTAQINALHGNFIGNYTVDILHDTLELTNYASAAGAINNSKSIIGNITGNFDGNYVVTHKSEDSAIAGAITNTSGTIAISTADDNVSFTGNYVNFVATDESVKTKYIAIQNRGTAERDAIIHISAYDENRVIFNDAITGAADQVENQIININNNTDGFGADIKSGVFEYSTVEFNNTVENQTINVENGTLKLGSFAGTNLTVAGKNYSLPAQQSMLVSSELIVNNSSTVIVDKADSLGNNNGIKLNNQSRMEVGAGVLSNDITVADAATLHIAANVTINSVLTVEPSASITGENNELRVLESVTLGINAAIYGVNISLSNSRIEASEPAAAPASNARADVIDIYKVHAEASIDDISGSLALHIAILDEAAFLDNYYKDIPLGVLLTDIDGLTMSDFGTNYDFYSNIHITFGSISATVTGVENSGSGVLFAVTIPEPSTATLSLLALAGLLARRRRKES